MLSLFDILSCSLHSYGIQSVKLKVVNVYFVLRNNSGAAYSDSADAWTLSVVSAVAYPDTNGYYGTYLDLYLAEFTSSLQWYVDNLDYSEGWTWFNANGTAMTDNEVAAMTTEDKAQAPRNQHMEVTAVLYFLSIGVKLHFYSLGTIMHRKWQVSREDFQNMPDGSLGKNLRPAKIAVSQRKNFSVPVLHGAVE